MATPPLIPAKDVRFVLLADFNLHHAPEVTEFLSRRWYGIPIIIMAAMPVGRLAEAIAKTISSQPNTFSAIFFPAPQSHKLINEVAKKIREAGVKVPTIYRRVGVGYDYEEAVA